MDNKEPTSNPIGGLIDYLTDNIDNIRRNKDAFAKFESYVFEVAVKSSGTNNQSLRHILKTFGWTGKHFGAELSYEEFLQALSNLYISSMSNDQSNPSLSSEAQKILLFIPNILLTHLNEQLMHGQNNDCCTTSQLVGATVMIEMMGCAKLTTSLGSNGARGLSELFGTLNGFMSHIVNIVHVYGGDVISFDGTLLLCYFGKTPDSVAQTEFSTKESQKDAEHSVSISVKGRKQYSMAHVKGLSCCIRALQCGFALRDHSKGHLSVKIGVSFGNLKLSVFGGQGSNDDWSYVLHGRPIAEVTKCLQEAEMCEVIATESLYIQVSNYLHSTMMSTATRARTISEDYDSFLILGDDDKDKVDSSAIETRRCASNSGNLVIKNMPLKSAVQCQQDTNRLMRIVCAVPPEVINAARLFVAAPVLATTSSEELDRAFELRHVTILVLHCISTWPENHSAPDALSQLLRTVQQALHVSGGYLFKFLVSQEKVTFVALWGVPLHSYATNCPRSLFCALVVQRNTVLINWRTSAGIASGTAFCGLVGSAVRKEYVILGKDLAVAEVIVSSTKDEIAVDSSTFQLMPINLRCQFSEISSSVLDDHISMWSQKVYKYCGSAVPDLSMLQELRSEDGGRVSIISHSVKATLELRLDQLTNTISDDCTVRKQLSRMTMSSGLSSPEQQGNPSQHNPSLTAYTMSSSPSQSSISTSTYSVKQMQMRVSSGSGSWGKIASFVVVLGNAGSGKSTVARYFLEAARKRNLQCISVHCRPLDEGTPFSLAAKLFLEIVGVENFKDVHQQRAIIQGIMTTLSMSVHEYGLHNQAQVFAALKCILGLRWNQRQGSGLDDNQPRDNNVTSRTVDGNDPTYYDVLRILLKNRRTVIVVDDAQYCDELSWHQLQKILGGSQLPVSVLITSRMALTTSTTSLAHASSVRSSISMSEKLSMRSFGAGSNSESSKSTSSRGFFGMASEVSRHDDGTQGMFGQYTFSRIQNETILSIMAQDNSTVIELRPLGKRDIGDIIMSEIGMSLATPELITLIHEFTSGNAFWCMAVAKYIKDHGVEEFKKLILQPEGFHTSLNSLIVSRFDELGKLEQRIIKHASVIGEEFSVELLAASFSEQMSMPDIAKSIGTLRETTLISSVEDSEYLFTFQNPLIRTTVYHLLPATEACVIHLAIAQYIEKKYFTSIWNYYPILSYHYRNSTGTRYPALKFTVKAAKAAIRRGAYSEGFAFLQAALPLAVTRPELRALLQITVAGSKEICPTIGGFGDLFRRFSASHKYSDDNRDTSMEKQKLYLDYCEFKDDIDKTLEFMSKNQSPAALIRRHMDSLDPSDRDKDPLEYNGNQTTDANIQSSLSHEITFMNQCAPVSAACVVC